METTHKRIIAQYNRLKALTDPKYNKQTIYKLVCVEQYGEVRKEYLEEIKSIIHAKKQ